MTGRLGFQGRRRLLVRNWRLGTRGRRAFNGLRRSTMPP